MPFNTKVYLRRAERDDLDTVVAWMECPDFQYFLYGDPARSPKQIRDQIVKMLGRTGGNTMPTGIYLMIDSEEYGPVGLLSLQHLSWRNRSCNIDLYISKASLRSGTVAAFAVYRALEYCFDELDLHRVGAFIYAFNTASWRILEKTGAVRELVLPDHVPREGILHDLYCYGLLRPEFAAMRERYGKAMGGISLQQLIEGMSAGEAD